MFVPHLNYGIFKERDFEIADLLIDVSRRSGYPENVNIQWAKNSNENIVKLAKKIGSTGRVHKGITLSVQSMTEEVPTGPVPL